MKNSDVLSLLAEHLVDFMSQLLAIFWTFGVILLVLYLNTTWLHVLCKLGAVVVFFLYVIFSDTKGLRKYCTVVGHFCVFIAKAQNYMTS